MNLQEPFPLSFGERPLRFSSAPADPVKLVQQQLARLHEAQREVIDRLLVHLAQTCFHLERASRELATCCDAEHAASGAEALTIIAENLRDVLADHQTRWEDHTGRTWTAEMRDDVELRGHQVCDQLTEPRVAHVELPVVYRAERRIARGAAIIETPRRDGSSL